MHRNQANRAVIARRAAERARLTPQGTEHRPTTPGTNPAMRSMSPAHPMAAGPVRRSRCAPLTAMQRDSEGNLSAWNRPTDYFTDPKWSRTVSDGVNP